MCEKEMKSFGKVESVLMVVTVQELLGECCMVHGFCHHIDPEAGAG